MKIALISDTHSYFGEDINKYLKDVDEIWHAGDIGDQETADKYRSLAPFRAVYGNIDPYIVRYEYPEHIFFEAERMKILMMHIGGYPGRYSPKAKNLILKFKPDVFISGHSHILKVMFDDKLSVLHMNPGSCGIKGMHRFRTLLLFDILSGKVENLRVVEITR